MSHQSISISWKESGDPHFHHSSSPLPLADPIFDSDGSQFRRLVNVDVLVMMNMDVTEDNGVFITCRSN